MENSSHRIVGRRPPRLIIASMRKQKLDNSLTNRVLIRRLRTASMIPPKFGWICPIGANSSQVWGDRKT
jgi:hypothetical protein